MGYDTIKQSELQGINKKIFKKVIDREEYIWYINCTNTDDTDSTINTVRKERDHAMFSLSYNDHRPIYEQIKEKVKQLIISGAMPADTQLPSVRDLAQQMAINPNTIQRAYKELEAEGYIYSVRAKGSFVAPVQKSALQDRCTELLAELVKTVRELAFAGVPKAEVLARVEHVYSEGGSIS